MPPESYTAAKPAGPHPRSLVIYQAANGYIVHGDPSTNYCASNETSHVFQTFEELSFHLEKHFTHRANDLRIDPPAN